MADILLSQDEYARLKAVVVEAYALRDYLDNVRKTAARIMPFHIEMPALRHALNEAMNIDLDNRRKTAEVVTLNEDSPYQWYELKSEINPKPKTTRTTRKRKTKV